MADYSRIKTTRVTSSSDVKAFGGPAFLHGLVIFNNGSAGTPGNVEVRDAELTPGDGGTLRFDIRHQTVDEDVPAVTATTRYGQTFPAPIYMPQGIRITLNTITNVVIWVLWEG